MWSAIESFHLFDILSTTPRGLVMGWRYDEHHRRASELCCFVAACVDDCGILNTCFQTSFIRVKAAFVAVDEPISSNFGRFVKTPLSPPTINCQSKHPFGLWIYIQMSLTEGERWSHFRFFRMSLLSCRIGFFFSRAWAMGNVKLWNWKFSLFRHWCIFLQSISGTTYKTLKISLISLSVRH